MVQEVLICISLLIAIAAATTIIARLIKQPPIIAYLVAGILAGPLFFNIISGNASDLIQILARIGVAFLLFIVGLNLDLRLLKEVGPVSIISGVIGMVVTSCLGFLISLGFGFSNITSVYIGAILAFSSTVVVVKILSDKKEIDSLHGRIALGILIIQDFVAAIALMAIPIISRGGNFLSIFSNVLLALGLIVVLFLFSGFVLLRFLNYLARSQEALFLFGIAWALVLATVFNQFGFSLEIGALVAGMSLASSKYNLELGGKMKPLRDFFVVLFFVFFGSQLSIINSHIIYLAGIFSLFVFIIKPLVTMTSIRFFGYTKSTNFFASTSIAQVSEFSLILALVGFNLGYLTQEIISLTILIALFTIGLSSYSIYYSHFIFNKLSRGLSIFESKNLIATQKRRKTYDIILFGYHRIGYKILKTLKDSNANFVVVDYNPRVILALIKENVPVLFGDASDKELLEELGLGKTKLVISTIPDENSNYAIRKKLKETKSDAVLIATTEHSKEALEMYHDGVDFVIVPQHLGGNYAAEMIKKYGLNKRLYREEGRKHLKEMQEGKKNSNYK